MEQVKALFLSALASAVRGQGVPRAGDLSPQTQSLLFRLAREQGVFPMIVQALFDGADSKLPPSVRNEAHDATLHQAERTANFLLLYEALEKRGLRPAVLKGLVCRSLYPSPEQRPSTDEDLLIGREEFARYHTAFLDNGLRPVHPETASENADEVAYFDRERDLYIELHLQLFPSDSQAYGDCNSLFEGTLSHCVEQRFFGIPVRTLAPSDHLMYLLCHAYKHLLHGGVGIRQICDICLFARHYGGEIDWTRVRRACGELQIGTLAAAFFRMGERHLDIPGPRAFDDLTPDEEPLLYDCLTGGLYGADDPDRLHSSTLTLEAVASEKQGRRQHGLVKALFPSVNTLAGRFSYLRRRPWLLPAAWMQRFVCYLREKSTPSKTLQIGQERIELLRQYGVLD